MQPESNESSPSVQTPITPSTPSNASQYGIYSQHLPSADLREALEDDSVSEWSSDAGNAAEPPSVENSPLPQQLGRLSLNDRDDARPKPSFQRISEYENALAPSPPRQLSEGPAFKIIKRKGNRLDAPQLDNFPNGMLLLARLEDHLCSLMCCI